jgi:peptidoglycan hydrolase CwlO-like protein
MKKITSLIVTVIVIVAILPTTFVYAQTITTVPTPEEQNSTATTTTAAPIQSVTPSATAQQIINNTKAECEQAQMRQGRCVILIYESPTTVVLKGLMAIYGGNPESPSSSP